jgi:alpha-tubulin suppressor-like RCC1 family protein
MTMTRVRTNLIVALNTALLALACHEATAPGTNDPIDDSPAAVTWSTLSVGAYSSCALTTAGRAYCWGFNPFLPCTQTGCVVDSLPTPVPGAPELVAVSVGGFQSCGMTRDAQLWCWGQTYGTTLGDGVTTGSPSPVLIPLPARIAQLSAGYSATCVLDVAGVAYCWGGPGAPIGAGPGVDRTNTPLAVATPLRFTAISVGNTQACAIDTNRDAYCWGTGYGSLGIGAADTSCKVGPSCTVASAPMLVVGGLKWADISAGNAFTCGVTIEGAGYCWGDVKDASDPYGPSGVLGSGVFAGSKSPVAVAGGLRFRMIRTGTRQACAVTTEGAAFCWGVNEAGELGIGHADIGAYSLGSGKYAAPQPVVGGLVFRSISEGEVSCGISSAANLYCWGVSYGGQLGNGNTRPGYRAIPTRAAPPL